ncbi:uncharacterized protein LOC5574795 isoform X1 [Aedes aegypti]|uniref:Uncharacterized protein n=1 Tax=Aedes aegypti TaxID=7159 RepID=A0A6I8T6I0_AEDAE|nr:uncharacterized protein LOC5574795 isoform X1 [Aedes aegypti]
MDDLLSYLKKHHFPHLPKTNKTLKADAKLCDMPITRMGEGEFCYLGLKRAVEQIMIKNNVKPNCEIHYRLQFGIDGLPLTKSSKSSFWPILVKIIGFRDVLPVAVFCGTSKPSSIHEYMHEFVEELDHVLKVGMEINNLRVMFSVDAFIMDAPAKAFVMDIKAHNGLYGCPKCTTRGRSIGHRTVFPNIGFELRTDDSFLNLSDPHHLSDRLPPLATIGIGCVSCVPIDYMHNVCLGGMKSLLNLWVETSGKSYSLTPAQKCIIDSRIEAVKRQVCSDFSRTPRPLTDLKWFKATELRLLLLYLGPFIFLNVMSDAYYNHFLKLHAAIRILCHPVKYQTENDKAKNLLEAFGHEFMTLYGEHLFVYNFHTSAR